MNTIDAADLIETTGEEIPVPSRLTTAVVLPYLALAATLAAYSLDAPGRLAALVRGHRTTIKAVVPAIDYPPVSHRS